MRFFRSVFSFRYHCFCYLKRAYDFNDSTHEISEAHNPYVKNLTYLILRITSRNIQPWICVYFLYAESDYFTFRIYDLEDSPFSFSVSFSEGFITLRYVLSFNNTLNSSCCNVYTVIIDPADYSPDEIS